MCFFIEYVYSKIYNFKSDEILLNYFMKILEIYASLRIHTVLDISK